MDLGGEPFMTEEGKKDSADNEGNFESTESNIYTSSMETETLEEETMQEPSRSGRELRRRSTIDPDSE